MNSQFNLSAVKSGNASNRTTWNEVNEAISKIESCNNSLDARIKSRMTLPSTSDLALENSEISTIIQSVDNAVAQYNKVFNKLNETSNKLFSDKKISGISLDDPFARATYNIVQNSEYNYTEADKKSAATQFTTLLGLGEGAIQGLEFMVDLPYLLPAAGATIVKGISKNKSIRQIGQELFNLGNNPLVNISGKSFDKLNKNYTHITDNSYMDLEKSRMMGEMAAPVGTAMKGLKALASGTKAIKDSKVSIINKKGFIDGKLLPLSDDQVLRSAQQKIINGESLTLGEKIKAGRDKVTTKIGDYKLRSDHAYRAINSNALEEYAKTGRIYRNIDEYIPGENNGGIDWYLGGASTKYGNVVLECPAKPEYFTLASDYGSGMAQNPLVRHIKSSSQNNTIPFDNVSNIFVLDLKGNLLHKMTPSEFSKQVDNISSITDNYVRQVKLDNLYGGNKKLVFYHGGVESDFSLEKLDVMRLAEKQQKKGGSYAGFYMYSEVNKDGAIRYANQQNNLTNTTSKGLVKIELSSDAKVYEVEPFQITRIRQEKLQELADKGYDVIAGRMLGKTEYVLLNKSKVLNLEFENIP